MSLEIGALLSLVCAQVAILGALAAFVFRFMQLNMSHGLDVPYVRTPPEYFETIAGALALHPGDCLYDLGCGDGAFVTFLAKRYPATRCVGVERDRTLVLQARIRRLVAGSPPNLVIKRADFYTIDFSDATHIYAYLYPKILATLLGDRFPIRIISRAFEIPGRAPTATIQLTSRPGWHNQHIAYLYEPTE